ncbi:MAG: rod shape-determining protein RodA [Candidatus Omnitrophota bacterium]|nr:rod shape-determining protein RodA [Candidatus Omnitrophota bacterium]
MRKFINKLIITITIFLIFVGLITIYSATRHIPFKSSETVLSRQIIWAIIGIIILLIVSNINYRRFYEIAYVLYVISLILLGMVIILGREISGAQRWLEIGGFNFQPSELSKLVIILFLSRYFSHKRFYHNKISKIWWELILPLFFVALPVGLIFLQPDLGTASLIFIIFLILLFQSEIKLKYFFVFLSSILAALPFIWHFLRDYQKERLLVFLNPNFDPLGAGYTIIQSKIAIGSGRFLGKGWLSGTQNQLNFLPERHTDFIFSVIGEEWGFMGAIALLVCYMIIISYAMQIAQSTKDRFGFFLALGVVGLISFQTIINILMAMGICPVVGLSLPLISYGGSSLIIYCFLIGILLSINKKRIVF